MNRNELHTTQERRAGYWATACYCARIVALLFLLAAAYLLFHALLFLYQAAFGNPQNIHGVPAMSLNLWRSSMLESALHSAGFVVGVGALVHGLWRLRVWAYGIAFLLCIVLIFGLYSRVFVGSGWGHLMIFAEADWRRPGAWPSIAYCSLMLLLLLLSAPAFFPARWQRVLQPRPPVTGRAALLRRPAFKLLLALLPLPLLFFGLQKIVQQNRDRALLDAAWKGDAAATQTLLRQGAATNISDDRSWNQEALSVAAARGHLEIVKALLAKGADVQAKDGIGRTALNLAADQGHAEVVKVLREAGADINARDYNGWTQLMLAVNRGSKDSVKALLHGGADVNARSPDGGTALMYAAQSLYPGYFGNTGNADLVRDLLDAGAEVSAANNRGETALMTAMRRGQAPTVKILVDCGADITALVDADATPSTLWLKGPHDPAIEQIIKQARILKKRNP